MYGKNEMENDMRKHVRLYGHRNRRLQAIEEMSELIKVLLKSDRLSFDPTYESDVSEINANILEEIADVEIMLYELKYMYDFTQKRVDEVKKIKIKRTNLKLNKLDKERSKNVKCNKV